MTPPSDISSLQRLLHPPIHPDSLLSAARCLLLPATPEFLGSEIAASATLQEHNNTTNNHCHVRLSPGSIL